MILTNITIVFTNSNEIRASIKLVTRPVFTRVVSRQITIGNHSVRHKCTVFIKETSFNAYNLNLSLGKGVSTPVSLLPTPHIKESSLLDMYINNKESFQPKKPSLLDMYTKNKEFFQNESYKIEKKLKEYLDNRETFLDNVQDSLVKPGYQNTLHIRDDVIIQNNLHPADSVGHYLNFQFSPQLSHDFWFSLQFPHGFWFNCSFFVISVILGLIAMHYSDIPMKAISNIKNTVVSKYKFTINTLADNNPNNTRNIPRASNPSRAIRYNTTRLEEIQSDLGILLENFNKITILRTEVNLNAVLSLVRTMEHINNIRVEIFTDQQLKNQIKLEVGLKASNIWLNICKNRSLYCQYYSLLRRSGVDPYIPESFEDYLDLPWISFTLNDGRRIMILDGDRAELDYRSYDRDRFSQEPLSSLIRARIGHEGEIIMSIPAVHELWLEIYNSN